MVPGYKELPEDCCTLVWPPEHAFPASLWCNVVDDSVVHLGLNVVRALVTPRKPKDEDDMVRVKETLELAE